MCCIENPTCGLVANKAVLVSGMMLNHLYHCSSSFCPMPCNHLVLNFSPELSMPAFIFLTISCAVLKAPLVAFLQTKQFLS
eukprot:c22969_g1_i5 orf=3-242(-)